MTLPAFDTIELVPEPFRPLYEVRDGKAHPKATPAPAPLGDGGEAALKAEREARKAAEKAAKDEKKRADDLEAARQATAANIPTDQLAKWTKEREDAVAAEAAKTQAAEAKLRQFEIGRLFRELAVLPDVNVFMERLDEDNLAIMTRRLGMTKGGALCVLDADGEPTTEDPKAHILGIKAKRPYLFRGSGSDGSGSEPSVAGGTTGYDAVAEGKRMAAEQKKANEASKLALT